MTYIVPLLLVPCTKPPVLCFSFLQKAKVGQEKEHEHEHEVFTCSTNISVQTHPTYESQANTTTLVDEAFISYSLLAAKNVGKRARLGGCSAGIIQNKRTRAQVSTRRDRRFRGATQIHRQYYSLIRHQVNEQSVRQSLLSNTRSTSLRFVRRQHPYRILNHGRPASRASR
jgi:hypothetical protein